MLADLAGKTIMLGVIDLADETVETPEQVAQRIRAALKYIAAEAADPGAGLRDEVSSRATPRSASSTALSAGAAIVRSELS